MTMTLSTPSPQQTLGLQLLISADTCPSSVHLSNSSADTGRSGVQLGKQQSPDTRPPIVYLSRQQVVKARIVLL